ncbi:MAG TPA: efflux RND transporter periplasmic adaptor subunit [Gammaproteobacteria bacterium]
MRTRTNSLIILAGALLALSGCGNSGEAGKEVAQPAKLPFETTAVTLEKVVKEEIFDATIDAVHQATVSAQTSGRITEINFDVDDYVKKGDILIRFRAREQAAALSGAEARFKEANSNFERIKDLLQQKLVSQAEYDRAEAALKSARAALEQSQEQTEHTVVRAPYSGIVVKRYVEVGELANPGQPLMTGLSLEELRAVVNLPEAYIQQVRSLAHARIIFTDENDQSIESTKLNISPYADPQTHTFRVRVDIPAGQHNVYPGEFAKVAFATGEENLLLVPEQAVVHRSEVTGVYVVSPEGRVALRQIRLGRRYGNRFEVLAGLTNGDKVALDPIQAGVYLKEKRAGKGS